MNIPCYKSFLSPKNPKNLTFKEREKGLLRLLVTTHVVSLKVFRLKVSEKHNCRTLAAKHLPSIASSGEAGGQIFTSKMA
jgi:hypothetical protein